ncbi:Pyruvate/Phosphoenolpyruvate kinase-like domain-containing protein [Aspergillus sergii]|uniref:Pyruvate/Phosphoenolpyruvate kinase-like domain-containing protein n=1 Tax=Aspergillus sergii TaxID=1034303 RepID=A0A5N6XGE3_9EURO|nr:Pyruvate/Phosphoenolpyruvate kinase-like domain-containing protein [Aspergillus sergii]
MYTNDDASFGSNSRGPTDTSLSFVDAIQQKNRPLLGALLALTDPTVAKLAARVGFDWVLIDAEHSPYSPAKVTELVHAIHGAADGSSCLPLIRVPSHGTEYIKWALDSGAAGIIVPMVQTAGEMEAIVQRALYPPRGQRSFGPYHAQFADSNTRSFLDYYDKAQRRDIAILPILESREAVQNAESILRVDGVTGAFIGPYDLRLSLGLPGGSDGEEPEFVNAVSAVCRLGRQLGKPIGSMGSNEALARKRAQEGIDFLLVSFDYSTIVQGYQRDLDSARRGIQQTRL